MIGTILAVALVVAGGCSTMQAIDQWKCDNLGWCCFGARPNAPPCPAPAVCPPPVADCPPAAGCSPAGCAPVTITTPGTIGAPVLPGP